MAVRTSVTTPAVWRSVGGASRVSLAAMCIVNDATMTPPPGSDKRPGGVSTLTVRRPPL
jgi:hypothetical protein